jgi:hypothetical protein
MQGSERSCKGPDSVDRGYHRLLIHGVPGLAILPGSPPVVPSPVTTPARLLPPQTRQQLALDALGGPSVTELAARHQVSRKFVYQQQQKAHDALDHTFAATPDDPPGVLFWLPVTKPWLRQLVLGLTLIGHSSLRGVTELLADIFDYPLSVGTVHNILHQAVADARTITAGQDLAAVRLGAHDEIFQAGRPVLVGAAVASTYCYLLSPEAHRDADTWGVRLLELGERGFQPDATIADFAGGLRAGQAEALPDVPCRGDIFHALQTATPLAGYLENRAYEAIAIRSRLENRQARTEHRQGRKDASLAGQLRVARAAEAQAVALAEDVALLVRWLQHDVLAVRGPDFTGRCALYDWIVAELRLREPHCPHRIRPVRCLLENQRDALLAFAKELDQDLQALAEEFAVPATLVEEVRAVLSLPSQRPERWQREQGLWARWGSRYGLVRQAVEELLGRVVRASSVIENLNSRLRSYFFLRRHLGEEYLTLLQFFLNHRRFLRSEHAERVGKSPVELLTGQVQPHWLELLGFTPFSRN